MNKLLLFTGSFFVLFSCGDSSTAEATQEPQAKEVKTEEDIALEDAKPVDTLKLVGDYDHYYEDMANFIAGVKSDFHQSFEEHVKTAAWQDYSAQSTGTWNRFASRKLDPISNWVKTNITAKKRNAKTVFYPFSGPDFNYVNAMLPEGDVYYMMGLEPLGKIPDLNDIDKDSIESVFQSFNAALEENLNLSFFITKQMKHEMNNDHVTGTIPILMFFLARNNKRIINIAPVSISDQGELMVTSGEGAKKKFRNIVEFTFTDEGSDVIKKLYYFSMNIANSGFYSGSTLQKFMETMPNDITTMVKSASFCMHEDKFSSIRDLILRKSKNIIEDDSGIPFRFFDKEKWDLYCYGTYDGPVEVFKEYMQEDYKIAFDEKAYSLPFRYGYDQASNLLIATRKD